MVIEPTGTRQQTNSSETNKQVNEKDALQEDGCSSSGLNRWVEPPEPSEPSGSGPKLTVSAALVDGRADAASVEDGGADVVPLVLAGEPNVIVDLNRRDKKDVTLQWDAEKVLDLNHLRTSQVSPAGTSLTGPNHQRRSQPRQNVPTFQRSNAGPTSRGTFQTRSPDDGGPTMASQIRSPRLHSRNRQSSLAPFRNTRVLPTT